MDGTGDSLKHKHMDTAVVLDWIMSTAIPVI